MSHRGVVPFLAAVLDTSVKKTSLIQCGSDGSVRRPRAKREEKCDTLCSDVGGPPQRRAATRNRRRGSSRRSCGCDAVTVTKRSHG